jgi:hypothetical protein
MPESETVKAVYELREAALAHGKAIAQSESDPAAGRDDVLATGTLLEEKTIAALDECSDNAEEAAAEAVEQVQLEAKERAS